METCRRRQRSAPGIAELRFFFIHLLYYVLKLNTRMGDRMCNKCPIFTIIFCG